MKFALSSRVYNMHTSPSPYIISLSASLFPTVRYVGEHFRWCTWLEDRCCAPLPTHVIWRARCMICKYCIHVFFSVCKVVSNRGRLYPHRGEAGYAMWESKNSGGGLFGSGYIFNYVLYAFSSIPRPISSLLRCGL